MSENTTLRRLTDSEMVKLGVPILTPEQSKNIMQNYVVSQHIFGQDPLITKAVEDANKRVRQSQDNIHKVTEYASRIHSLEYELKKANSQIKTMGIDNSKQLSKIENLNNTVEILKRDLEIARLKTDVANNKISNNKIVIRLVDVIISLILMFIEYFVIQKLV